jgi:hypothetical protein
MALCMTNPKPIRSRRLQALIAANLLMALAIAAVPFARRATAQEGGAVRSVSTYSMAGGNIGGVDAGVLFIVDETHEEMISVMWNEKSRLIVPIGYRNLNADAAGGARPRP